MEKQKQWSIFNCSICGQPFSSRHSLNKGGRVPLVLNCGHNACDSCIARLINKPGDSLTCQICNTESTASDNFNGNKVELEFPQNPVVLGKLVQKSQSGWDDHKISFSVQSKVSSPRTVECHECSERRAEMNCVQCQVPYCSVCFNRVHQIAKAFKGHVFMDLADLANIETKCSVHNVTLQFWCERCLVAICSNCVTSTHYDHTISRLVDRNKDCFREFLDTFSKVSNVQARLKATRKKAASSLSKLENTKYKEVEMAVTEHFSRLHGLLIARENHLLSLLYSPTRGTANSLKNMLQQMDLSIEELESQLESSSSLIENDTKYLNCASYMEVLEKLRSKETTPCFLVVSSETADSSKFKFDEDIFEKLKSHGEMDVSEDVPVYRLVTEEQLPPDFTIDPIKSISFESVVKNCSSLDNRSGSSISPSASLVSLSSSSQPDPLPGPQGGAQAAADTSSNDSYNRNFDELVEGCKVKVILTHATSPNDFYVRRLGMERKMVEINQIFSKLNLKTPSKDRIRPGDRYMAQFSQDHRWYRCLVTEVDGNLINVFYIDFGNREIVKRENMRLLPHALLKYDGMAMHCSLHDCIPVADKWDPQTITTMLKIADNNNGELSITICKRSSELLYVDLLRSINMDVVSLRKALVFLNLARPAEPPSTPLLCDKVTTQRPLPQSKTYDNGYVTDVVITHCVSPYEFYVQDTKSLTTVNQLKSGLHEMYSKKSERMIVYHPKIDMIVAALNAKDNEWRRAKITAIPDYKKVRVNYLDFGDSEILSFKRLRYLGHKFFKIGIQCWKCRLVDIVPKEGEDKGWSGAANERFADLVQYQSGLSVLHPRAYKPRLSLVIHSHEADTYRTVLYKNQGNTALCINAALVSENFAISTGVSSSLLEIPSSVTDEAPPEVGTVFKERRGPKGSRGGRSREFEEGSQTLAEVRELLMAQSILPNIHQSMPQLTHQQPRSSSSYVGGSTASLMLPDMLAAAAAVKPLSPKTKESSSSTDNTTTSPDNPKESIKLPVDIVKVVSPSEIYVTPTSLVPKLTSLKASMQRYYGCEENQEKLAEVSVKAVCVTKRLPQGDWCRAVIVRLLDNDNVEVHLPDFGDVLEVNKSELLTMAEKFQAVRDGATRCHLGGLKQPLEDRWPMTSTDEIVEFADKYHGKIFITKLGEERANSLPVEVLMKEEVTASALEPTKVIWTSLNNKLRMRGLALSDGTINWDLEDFKFTAVKQQVPRLQMEVFKGIPIKYAGIADSTQEDLLEGLSNADSTFGLLGKMADDEEVLPEDSISRLSISDSCNTLAEESGSSCVLQETVDDNNSLRAQRLSPQVGLPLPIPVPVMPKSWPPPLPFTKLEFIAHPTNVNNNASIFLQDFQKSISSLKRIGEILDSNCRMSLPQVHDMYWSVDQTCIARYHLDNKWYRGVIKSVKEDNTLMVELVDYGNIEECSVSDLRKKPLATEFPIQGQFCHLHKIKPNTGDGKWTIPVLDKMHAMVVEKHCLVKLSIDQFDQSYNIENVKLPDGSELLAYLVKEGVAVYDESFSQAPCSFPAPGETGSSTLTSELPEASFKVISQTDLSSHQSPYLPDPLQVEGEASTEDSEMLPFVVLEGSSLSAAALAPQDQDCSPLTAELPEGEEAEDVESELRTKSWVEQCEAVLYSEGSVRPESAVQKQPSLQPGPEIQVPSIPVLSEGVPVLAPVQASSDLSQHSQEIECDSLYLFLEVPTTLQRFEVEVQDVFVEIPEMITFHIVNSDDLKLNNSRESFLKLSDDLQEEAPHQPIIQTPQINDACCAQFSADNAWYRALIIAIPEPGQVVVRYVDFGNIEKLPLSKVREMKEEWLMVEVQLILARLHNLAISVPDSKWGFVKFVLGESLLEQRLTCIVQEYEPVLSVEIYEGDKLAYENLIEDKFFRPIKKQLK